MGKKKRLAAIADAVTDIIGTEVDKKKLKKKKALRRFLGKMVAKQEELTQILESGVADETARLRLQRHLATLDEQIAKALQIQQELEEE